VHRAARQLEQSIGVVLFESTSHGLRPSREAERLAHRTRLAIAEIAQARAEVAALAGEDRGHSVVGAMPLARSVIVPSAVLKFSARRPGHSVSILDGPYESLLAALRAGQADLLVGALRDSRPEDIVQEHLFDDPLALLVRAGHPLLTQTRGGRRAPSAAALARYAWIAPRRGSPLRRQYERLVRPNAATKVPAAVECNSLVAARALLAASDRVMLLSAHQAHHELATGTLLALPHPDGPVSRPIGLTLRRDWHATPAQRELLDAIREAARVASLTRSAVPRGRGTRAATRPSGARRIG
jgi:DNA-binding transcriptional LysR family regulator